jgi:hypothetical protein
LSFFATQEKLAQDNDEPKGSWLFCATQEKQVDDELCNLLLSFGTQGKKPQDDDELGGLLLSSLTKKKTHKMTMS